uniref:EP1-like glycoprotein 4 n=1 Tax=Erigeron canadensis TaxID=72917 RepID=UPI001CB9667D|nr:EP1-like glycoprotein 4 [Erigeron canadensis]
MRSSWISSAYLAMFLMLSFFSPNAEPFEFPNVNLPTVEPDFFGYAYDIFKDGSRLNVITSRIVDEITYHCGFFCTGSCTSFIFVVFIIQTSFEESLLPQIVWSANRDNPVANTAILNLTETGDLVLKDADGTIVWSTNTTGKSVVGVNLTDTGNLVLFDVNNATIWQSFDHPTDCLLPGQKLYKGQKLKSSVSSTNWSSQEGMYSLQITNNGLFAFVESNPPQVYYSYLVNGAHENRQGSFTFYNGSLAIFSSNVEPDRVFNLESPLTNSFVKLMPDGHLKLFQLPLAYWRLTTVVTDLLTDFIGKTISKQ